MSSRRPDVTSLLNREALLASFADQPGQSRSLRALIKQHRVPPSHHQAMRRLLEQLVSEGLLIRHNGLRFQLTGGHRSVVPGATPAKRGRDQRPPSSHAAAPGAGGLIGRLWRHPDGYGFVSISARPNDPDVFITRQGMGNALHGDQVEVKLVELKGRDRFPAKRGGRRRGRGQSAGSARGSGSGGRGPTGRIVRVVERARPRIVGRYQSGPQGGVVVPLDERLSTPLPVASSAGRHVDQAGQFPSAAPTVDPASMVSGSLVVGELPSTGPLTVRVVRDFGLTDAPQHDTDLVLEEFGWPTAFSAETEREAAAFGSTVPSPVDGRRDLRALTTVTIDGEQAKDFDDAISVERLAHGYRLWVHVADVGHYVAWDSALDLEARLRGTSVYFPDRAVPMLPERLSNGLCSLNPEEPRAAMTVEMEWSHDGRPLKTTIYESVIRSDARLTYPGVAAALQASSSNGGPDGVPEPYRTLRPMLQLAAEVAEKLRHRRMARGSLDFDLPEPEILLDLQGRPTDILREERTVAHRLIEECMLAANEAVAVFLTRLDVPMLYRIHEPPDPKKLAAFSHFAKGFGHVPPSATEALKSPITLQALLEAAKGRPEERLLNHLLLRSMKRARYGPEDQGHFGLGSDCYTHFTSPIRRYPDLVVHRILKQVLRHGPPSAAERQRLVGLLPELGQRSSDRERLSMEAEWQVVNVKKARFMLGRIGEVYQGFITGVARFGLFVELENIFVEGLVPARTLPNDQYRYDEEQHTLMGVRHRYRLADPVTVRVTGVDLDRRRVNFTLQEERASPQ
ncbi:MAG: ribonuclease R [Nitrospirae bacterium]|nr:ribonuclease R [Nitrospirota bacterium]